MSRPGIGESFETSTYEPATWLPPEHVVTWTYKKHTWTSLGCRIAVCVRGFLTYHTPRGWITSISPLMKRLAQGHLHPKIIGPETDMSRQESDPGRTPWWEASTIEKSYSNYLEHIHMSLGHLNFFRVQEWDSRTRCCSSRRNGWRRLRLFWRP